MITASVIRVWKFLVFFFRANRVTLVILVLSGLGGGTVDANPRECAISITILTPIVPEEPVRRGGSDHN